MSYITNAQPALMGYSIQQFKPQPQKPINAEESDVSLAKNKEPEKNATKTNATEAEKSAKPEQLSPEELRKIEQLEARDAEVKAHERAHFNAAGGLAIGGASFTFVTGSDGKRYAVGGEVSIDTSAVPGDPAATIKKAETIRRAALAPMNPSTADRQIAAKASSMAADARIELQQENNSADKTTKTENDSENNADNSTQDQQKPSQTVIDLIA